MPIIIYIMIFINLIKYQKLTIMIKNYNEQLNRQFIQITCTNQFIANKYLAMAKNNLDMALNYYWVKLENHQQTEQQPKQNQIFQILKKNSKRQMEKQKIIQQLKINYSKPVKECVNQNAQYEIIQKKEFQQLNYLPNVLKNKTNLKIKSTSKNITAFLNSQPKTKNTKNLIRRKNQYLEPKKDFIEQNFVRLGTKMIEGESRMKNNLAHLNQHSVFQIKLLGDMSFKYKKKLSQKKNISSQNFTIHIQSNNRQVKYDKQVARVKQYEAIILFPLLKNQSVRMFVKLFGNYNKVEVFDSIFFTAEFYLARFSLTEPILRIKQRKELDNFKEQSINKQFFNSFFQFFDFDVKINTLIPYKNKIQKPIKSSKSTSQHSIQFENSNQQNNDKQLSKFTNLKQFNVSFNQIQQPPSTFISKLQPYQLRALTWMLYRQGISINIRQIQQRKIHPLWRQYTFQFQSIFFNPFTGQLSDRQPLYKCNVKGGILADEMGLGKTVMMIALIHSNKCNQRINRQKLIANNLIIMPLSLLSQWQQQIENHSQENSLRVLRYYQKKQRKLHLEYYDIVLTTYGIISEEFSIRNHINKKGLFSHSWFRIILDQAHFIKSRNIKTAKAIYELQAQIRWCLTGTPIQNKLDDLFSLLHFLKIQPWSDYTIWNNYINKPFQQKDQFVFLAVNNIIKPIFMRRTKQSKDEDGKPIIELPQKIIKIKEIDFYEEERIFYTAVYESNKRTFQEMLNQGMVETKLMKIFQILTRLRQLCDHKSLYLIKTGLVNFDNFQTIFQKFLLRRSTEPIQIKQTVINQDTNQYSLSTFRQTYSRTYRQTQLKKIKQNAQNNCSICLSNVQHPVITICLHIFCKNCIQRTINIYGYCPICKSLLRREDFIPLPDQNLYGIDIGKANQRSSKLDAVKQQIMKIKSQDKIVIFSQFLDMLNLIQNDLKKLQLAYVRLDGSVNRKQRQKRIAQFRKNPKCIVFLASLRTGGLGLNLVEANKVFIVDPWWNPSVQQQAIQRIHRIGQKRDVQVIRFIMRNSIESKMRQMHKSKLLILQNTIEASNEKKNIQILKYLFERY